MLGIVGGRHLDEAEALGPVGLAIHHDVRSTGLVTGTLEDFKQLVFIDGVGQVSNVEA
jgi:hypothetical protein